MKSERRLRNRQTVFLFLFLATVVAPIQYNLQAMHPPPVAVSAKRQLILYFAGVGAKSLFSWLVEDIVNKSRISTPELKNVSSRFLSSSVMTAFKDILQDGLLMAGYTSAQATTLMNAFGAGSKLMYFFKLILMLAPLSIDVGKNIGTLFQEVGGESAEIAWDTLVYAVKGSKTAGAHDLEYPLKSYHGTALYCGYNDPYCLYAPQQEGADALRSVAEAAIGGLSRVGLQAGSIILGALLADLSFEIGKDISTFLVTNAFGPYFHQRIINIMEKAIQRSGQAAIFDLYRKMLQEEIQPVLEEIERSGLEANQKAIINKQEFTENVKVGLQTQLALKFALPAHKALM